MNARDYFVVDKEVGETPLQALERFRSARSDLAHVPLAYAGRLDPMASGKLIILVGEECKRQQLYHGLAKEYVFEVLFGAESDTGDVLGLISVTRGSYPKVTKEQIHAVCRKLVGDIELPYPHFSSKTVAGKPLHTWALEGRLDEIEIPTYQAEIFKLNLLDVRTLSIDNIYHEARRKIETVPPVTDERKALGNDFRRPEVRASWKQWYHSNLGVRPPSWLVGKFSCVCSSGTYMRTLAEVIARELGTCGLAYSIHRTKIGRYQALPFGFGFWRKQLE